MLEWLQVMGLKAPQHEGKCNLVVVAGAAVRHDERAGGGGFVYGDPGNKG